MIASSLFGPGSGWPSAGMIAIAHFIIAPCCILPQGTSRTGSRRGIRSSTFCRCALLASVTRSCRNGGVTLTAKGLLHAQYILKTLVRPKCAVPRRELSQVTCCPGAGSWEHRRWRSQPVSVKPVSQSTARSEQRVIVGAHPWVYAATQPRYDIYPILDQIFADVAYAGIEGLELMHTALHPADSVERISALKDQHHLPVIGMSYGGAMWDRVQHAELLKDAS